MLVLASVQGRDGAAPLELPPIQSSRADGAYQHVERTDVIEWRHRVAPRVAAPTRSVLVTAPEREFGPRRAHRS